METEREILDIVGVGFGPSNLSLAVALEEHESARCGEPVAFAFFERQPRLGWHRNMLLPSAKMQISFLKDLATFRNPASRYSFISYLHERGRLPQFVNNQDFFPTRLEFHDYLEWAEAGFADRVTYNVEVTGIRRPAGAGPGPLESVEVVVRDTRGETSAVRTRNVVVSTGLVPRMPIGIGRDDRVWHSSEFLERFRAMDPRRLRRIAVVGAGQSAAEIVRHVYDELPHAEVSAILPSYGYSIADDTPFANQVFDPAATDEYYFGSDRSREAFWRYHRNTNYSVVDDEVIRALFQRAYDDEVAGAARLRFVNLARAEQVKRIGDEVRISVHSLATEQVSDLDVDLLVCATGYDVMDPAGLLGDLDVHCLRDAEGRHRVERDYRLVTSPELRCGIYLQGGTEHTHGLASSLLSNIAVRSGEIADSLVGRRTSPQTVS
ncbi:lysine N(6)-hydroxylase/L-ornithine N(5)-oxygenase family protein [Kitasatospora sp. NPDC087861]|uniref:lysine N(6)-hydroxylase/L-ornithine N(5)-oxygenase family protein n=1 Tax=Kitasatospora sp. NPDC087861 TaxID=3364070 RepID=UPI0038144131